MANDIGHAHCRCMNLGHLCPNNHFADCKICKENKELAENLKPRTDTHIKFCQLMGYELFISLPSDLPQAKKLQVFNKANDLLEQLLKNDRKYRQIKDSLMDL